MPDTNLAIHAQRLSKEYRMHTRSARTFANSIFLHMGLQSNATRSLWALRDVDLNVARGECLGIIGANGSGKTTLLRLIAGCLTPTHGKVQSFSRICPLLEITSGLHPGLSILDNIRLAAALYGMSKQELKKRLDEIIYFGALEKYLYALISPVTSSFFVGLVLPIPTALLSLDSTVLPVVVSLL